MTNRFLLSALLSLTLSLLLFKPIFAQPENSDPAVDLITAVNALRSENKLPQYQVNSTLMIVAQAQADHMAKTGVASHFDAAGLRPYQRAVKAGYSVAGDLSQGGLFFENIDSGAGLSPADAVKKWKEDSLSLAVMLSPDLKDVGAGVAVANGVTYYVLDAGSALNKVELTSAVTPTPTLALGAVVTSTALEDGSIYHIVQPKEALWSIAMAYNIAVDDIKHLNRLTTDDIFEGQKILIYKPKAGTTITPVPGITFTATFGIPTSTATQLVTPTITATATPPPVSPASTWGGGIVVGAIVLIALLGAGIGSWLASKKQVPL